MISDERLDELIEDIKCDPYDPASEVILSALRELRVLRRAIASQDEWMNEEQVEVNGVEYVSTHYLREAIAAELNDAD